MKTIAAVRVPLWLVWSGVTRHPVLDRLEGLCGCEPSGESVPTVFDAATGTPLEWSTFDGYKSLRHLVACLDRTPLPYTSGQPYSPQRFISSRC